MLRVHLLALLVVMGLMGLGSGCGGGDSITPQVEGPRNEDPTPTNTDQEPDSEPDPDPKPDPDPTPDPGPTPVPNRVSVQFDYLPQKPDGSPPHADVGLGLYDTENGWWDEVEWLEVDEPGLHTFTYEFTAGEEYYILSGARTEPYDPAYRGVCHVDPDIRDQANAKPFTEGIIWTAHCRRYAHADATLAGLRPGRSITLEVEANETAVSWLNWGAATLPFTLTFHADGTQRLGGHGGRMHEGEYRLTVSQPAPLEHCGINDPEQNSVVWAFDALADGQLEIQCETIQPDAPVWDTTPLSPDFKSVTLSWGAVPGATGYFVYEQWGTEDPVEIALTSSTSFTLDLSLHLGLPDILVRACATPGNCSELSDPLALESVLTPEQKRYAIGYLKPDTAVGNSDFGASIAMTANGQWLVVGAPAEPVNLHTTGAVYLFEQVEGEWVQRARMTLEGAGFIDQRGHEFGAAVAIANHSDFGFPVIAVGIPGHTLNCAGTITIDCYQDYTASHSGMVQLYRYYMSSLDGMGSIKAPNNHAGSNFGRSVSLSADAMVLAVGAPQDRGEQAGGVTIPRLGALGATWDIDLVDTTAQPSLANSGAVFVSTPDGSSNLWFALTAYLKHPAALTEDVQISGELYSLGGGLSEFGTAVALSADGRYLAIGAPNDRALVSGVLPSAGGSSRGNFDLYAPSYLGAVHLWSFDNSDPTDPQWVERAWLKGNEFADYLLSDARMGRSVAVATWDEGSSGTGITVAAGAPLANPNGIQSGKLYLFRGLDADGSDTGDDLMQANTVTTAAAHPLVGAAEWNQLGHSVALSQDGRYLAVGAGDAAYMRMFEWGGSSYAPVNEALAPKFGEYNSGFGRAVSLSGNGRTLAVGMIGDTCPEGGFSLERGACDPLDHLSHAGAVLLY